MNVEMMFSQLVKQSPWWSADYISHIINTKVVEHFFVFSIGSQVFQDLSLQNLTCLTNHTAQ